MITRECVHLVTGSYFRSSNKDHVIRSTVGENPTLHTHFTALCVTDADLLAMEFSHFGEYLLRVYWVVVDLFGSCDLDLDPMTFIHERDPYSTVSANINFVYVMAFGGYHLTNRLTESTEIIGHAASRVVN